MSKLPDDLEASLATTALAGLQFSRRTDAKGVTCAWARLASKDDHHPAAEGAARAAGPQGRRDTAAGADLLRRRRQRRQDLRDQLSLRH
jgi:hypothetical protein